MTRSRGLETALGRGLGTALVLGRVSNLPTVWSNTLVGIALAGAGLGDPRLPLLLLAFSLFYCGGMYLNDAFDAEFDARHRRERPIPSGRVSVRTVYIAGYGQLAAGLALIATCAFVLEAGTGWPPVLSAAGLALAIVAYDRFHKENPFAPLLMATCRVLVYLTASLTISASLPGGLLVAAGVLLCYLAGLTSLASREHLNDPGSLLPLVALLAPLLYLGEAETWAYLALFAAATLLAVWRLRRRAPGDVPRAIAGLIAGIALVDAVILAAAGAPLLAMLAVAAYVLTRLFQHVVPGT